MLWAGVTPHLLSVNVNRRADKKSAWIMSGYHTQKRDVLGSCAKDSSLRLRSASI